MQTTNGTGGLCMTCNNAATCYYHATRGPALFCDLFDNHVTTKSDSSPFTLSDTTAPTEQTFKGLCINCDHRQDCSHAKSETGVWHCENYA
ncbi:MAG: hypothetical protein ABIG68_13915 [Acidobacteriota bacterium]